MFFRIKQPPEFLGKILRVFADAFQIIEIFCGNLLQYFTHASHAHGREAVFHTTRIELFAEIGHQFPAFGIPIIVLFLNDMRADVLHTAIVQCPPRTL